MKLFKDKEMTEELDMNVAIPMGIVDAGEVEAFEYWLVNDEKWELIRLKYALKTIDRKTGLPTEETSTESKVLIAPDEMKVNIPYSLIIEYAPSVDIETGLRVQLQTRGSSLRD